VAGPYRLALNELTDWTTTMTGSNAAAGSRPIEHAKRRAEKVRQDLELVGAELHLTNTILERELPAEHKTGDVRKAIDKSEAVVDDVAEARDELEEVEALLAQEIVERERLEHELARRRA
jgi:diguanylate cyclase